MRKETILNYEKEFLAWCKGESILLGAPASMHEKPLVWREVRDFNDWKPLDTVYVLNDSYSTYRKALAEGKIVQYNFGNYGINRKDFPNEWKDLDQSIGILADRACPENYRIKPEEPKFKVGDWVRDLRDNSVFQINSVNFNLNLSITNGVYIHWQPQLGEWCWFLNKGRIPVISQFHSLEIEGNRKYSATFPNTPHPMIGYYKYCEPFIGNLPTLSKWKA